MEAQQVVVLQFLRTEFLVYFEAIQCVESWLVLFEFLFPQFWKKKILTLT